MRVEIVDAVGLGERTVEGLKKVCRRALREEGARKDAVLSLALLGEDEMAAVNLRFTGREGATDVLAFPMNEESGEGYILGDVAICPDYVAAVREDYGVGNGEELAYVAVHGVLHLLGHGDGDEEGASRMEKRQREILRITGGGRCPGR